MNEDNDWDKVTEEYDCILDASKITDTRAVTNSTISGTPTSPDNKVLDRTNSGIASLATVSLMDSSVVDSGKEEGEELRSEQGDDTSTLLTPAQSQPLQIVSVGDETDEYAFKFHQKSLDAVLRKIPPDMKVCVVSVVGAFRTGKSFLLSWFLNYLHAKNGGGAGTGDEKWYETMSSLGNDGFDWRGGAERNTTGIWMWSEPHVLPKKSGSKEKIAVLLVDTQGMFDHETTMGLTAAIFGLSTLLSSYQIYNVDKRIQEDHLQQLAMFTEYGRMALQQDFDAAEPAADAKPTDDSVPEAIPEDEQTKAQTEKPQKSKPSKKVHFETPFQKMEFLVRDWQNFEDDEDLEACEAEMEAYLENVLAERTGSDLKATREHINSCFDEISCYLMCHPGFGVTKKRYTGDVKCIEPTFLAFLDRYCDRVFSNPVAKSIHGRELSAQELGAYIKNYAKMFESGAHFPEASTMLEATANANNTNAFEISCNMYKNEMDGMAGIKCTHYIESQELEQSHRDLFTKCEKQFDEMANFGSGTGIRKARIRMAQRINEHFDLYNKLNDSRNPLAGFETFIIPLTIGFIAISLRWIADSTCSSWSQTCKASSDVFSHVYQVVFFFLLIISLTKAKQISAMAGRVKTACSVIIGADEVAK